MNILEKIRKNKTEKSKFQLFRLFYLISVVAIIIIVIVAGLESRSIFHKMVLEDAQRDAMHVATALRDCEVKEFISIDDGKEGSLQFLSINWIDEQERQRQQLGGGAWCPLPDQWNAMMVFDTLVFNEYRSANTMRYDLQNWLLMLVGHDKAFVTATSKLSLYDDQSMPVGPSWKAALTTLSDTVLEEQFADVLNEKRIQALGKRRDRLLSQ